MPSFKLGRELAYLALSFSRNPLNATQLAPGIPMVKMVGSMHGNEISGSQLLAFLTDYLVLEYPANKRVKQLLESTEIYILPLLNPDGYVKSKVSPA